MLFIKIVFTPSIFLADIKTFLFCSGRIINVVPSTFKSDKAFTIVFVLISANSNLSTTVNSFSNTLELNIDLIASLLSFLFTVYLYLLHKYMLKFAGVNEEVEELRKQIRINNKNKQLMTNRIKKSQDETGYNLGSFDDKITGIQQVMQNTVEKRQEALENFESEIRHQITADITAANKDELLGLQQEFESKRQELSDKKEEIEQIEKQLKEEYEPVFGKDLLYKQRLNKFDSFCQENADLSLEEALTQYRALSGSKLLKK